MQKSTRPFPLHRWFFLLAVTGGALFVLLPALLQPDPAASAPAWMQALAPLPMLLLYALCGSAAVAAAPVGKKLLFAAGLLPFSLQSVALPGLQPLVLPLALLLSAQLLAMAFRPVRCRAIDWVLLAALALGVLTAAVCGDRLLSALLLFCFLLPLRRRTPRPWGMAPEIPDEAALRRAQTQNRLHRTALVLLRILGGLLALVLTACALYALPPVSQLRVLTPARLAGSAHLLVQLLCGGTVRYGGLLYVAGGLMPLLWGALLLSAIPCTPAAFRPTPRQRFRVLAPACLLFAVTALRAAAGEMLAACALPAAAALPAALWALTPQRLVLRSEKPGRLVLGCAGLQLLHTALVFLPEVFYNLR